VVGKDQHLIDRTSRPAIDRIIEAQRTSLQSFEQALQQQKQDFKEKFQ
jgi:hypothetical protein